MLELGGDAGESKEMDYLHAIRLVQYSICPCWYSLKCNKVNPCVSRFKYARMPL